MYTTGLTDRQEHATPENPQTCANSHLIGVPSPKYALNIPGPRGETIGDFKLNGDGGASPVDAGPNEQIREKGRARAIGQVGDDCHRAARGQGGEYVRRNASALQDVAFKQLEIRRI